MNKAFEIIEIVLFIINAILTKYIAVDIMKITPIIMKIYTIFFFIYFIIPFASLKAQTSYEKCCAPPLFDL